ncbi:putative F-box domain-containing protein [Medicago truncatula]|uniref:F-box protein interaction domain protein n=1 Tax=Medicago truncatula TaxID=3880 RepID=A0A072UI55_MEDTR|nr:F-box/kelch-repeat protein At3g23880 [Medicago truncatula]KEH28793.1 F-box protein interaction domain protein [Medicago truncatula]RHN58662.1 putative F-box domain-containing protein [Medicago truncatula]
MSTIPSPVFFSDDLLVEILSLLSVKSLLRFRCVSKSWNALISDPNFVKFHLKRSKSQNQLFTLVTKYIKTIMGESPYGSDYESETDYGIIPYPIPRLLDNPSFTLITDPRSLLNEKDCSGIAGSCNGLICLTGYRSIYWSDDDELYDYWLRLWNPATRKISPKIGCFRDLPGFVFNFGCDDSTDTFKVVASRYIRDRLTSEVRVFSLGDNVWRNIESFPVVHLNLYYEGFEHTDVFLNSTFNWLAIYNDIPITWYWFPDLEDITVEQIVIVSLDLGTESYNQYRLPRGFDEMPTEEPTVGVLRDCLCFSYSYKETDFIIWHMKEFGVEESWTQFLKISYHDLQLNYDFSAVTLKYHLQFLPVFLSKDGDTLVLSSSQEREAILYNWRDHRVERTGVTLHKTSFDDGNRSYLYWDFAKGFVESLIWIF